MWSLFFSLEGKTTSVKIIAIWQCPIHTILTIELINYTTTYNHVLTILL